MIISFLAGWFFKYGHNYGFMRFVDGKLYHSHYSVRL